jgi:CBS domain-containing protein
MNSWLATKTVITLGKDARVADALKLMTKHGIHHLLIVDNDDKAVGLFSERTLFVALAAGQGREAMTAAVLEYSNLRFLSIGPEAILGECLRQLKDAQDTCLVLLDRGKGVGIVTESDLIEILATMVGGSEHFPISMRGGVVMAENPLLQSLASLLSSAGI